MSFHILNFVTSLGFICGYLCKFDFAPLKGMHDIFIKITQHSNLRAMQSSISPRLLTEHGEIQKILRDITADVSHMLCQKALEGGLQNRTAAILETAEGQSSQSVLQDRSSKSKTRS